ncbi:hypothetical protein JOF39_001566 [Glutamicibacter protophormiae]|uniref:Uncharacterized protein n=1 Tax=Glutamicibacter protophormiae TaxID=37930 RepID=A0ABS4XPP3_GLUPR|nr:hypothetical protein [Glutamicibacter protophormiae]
METQKKAMPCTKLLVPSIGSTIHCTVPGRGGGARLRLDLFLAQYPGTGNRGAQRAGDQLLALPVDRGDQVVGVGFFLRPHAAAEGSAQQVGCLPSGSQGGASQGRGGGFQMRFGKINHDSSLSGVRPAKR